MKQIPPTTRDVRQYMYEARSMKRETIEVRTQRNIIVFRVNRDKGCFRDGKTYLILEPHFEMCPRSILKSAMKAQRFSVILELA